MATGQLPFAGNTSAIIFHSILANDPVSVVQLNPQLPPKLQEVIAKLLEKDRDLRYQSAADLRGDLRRLKRDTESGRKPAQSTFAQSAVIPAQPSGSAVVTAAGQHKFGLGIAALVAIVVIAAAAYGVYALSHASAHRCFPEYFHHQGHREPAKPPAPRSLLTANTFSM